MNEAQDQAFRENDLPPLKYCIRCEDPIPPEGERFFRAVLRKGQRLVEYFCAPCFKIWSPRAAARLGV